MSAHKETHEWNGNECTISIEAGADRVNPLLFIMDGNKGSVRIEVCTIDLQHFEDVIATLRRLKGRGGAVALASFEKEQARAVEQVKRDASEAASKAASVIASERIHMGVENRYKKTLCGLKRGYMVVTPDWSKVDCTECWFHKGHEEGADQ